jgi:hypothetical protein
MKGNETAIIKAQNQLVNTAILFALARASELNNSEVKSQGIGPGPIAKNTKYMTAQTMVK